MIFTIQITMSKICHKQVHILFQPVKIKHLSILQNRFCLKITIISTKKTNLIFSLKSKENIFLKSKKEKNKNLKYLYLT